LLGSFGCTLQDILESPPNDLLEHMVARFVVEKLRRLQVLPPARAAGGEIVNLDGNHALGIGVGEWIEQDVVDDAKDGGPGADTQRERKNRDGGKSRLIAQTSGTVAKVHPEPSHVHQTHPWRICSTKTQSGLLYPYVKAKAANTWSVLCWCEYLRLRMPVT